MMAPISRPIAVRISQRLIPEGELSATMKHWEVESATQFKRNVFRFDMYKEFHVEALANGDLSWCFS